MNRIKLSVPKIKVKTYDWWVFYYDAENSKAIKEWWKLYVAETMRLLGCELLSGNKLEILPY